MNGKRVSEIIRRSVSLFELKETELRPGCLVIELGGELDLAVVAELKEALERARGYRLVLIDLSSCEFLDSTGIAVFVRAHRDFGNEGRTLAAFGADDQVLRVLSVTGLTENGLIVEDAEQALRSANQSQHASSS